MDTVGADDEVAFGRGTVGEVRDDGMAGDVVDADEALVVVNGNVPRLSVLDDGAMKGGASDHDTGLAVTCRISAGCTGEEFAALIFEGPLVAGNADVANLFDGAGGSEDVHAVGGKSECSARVAWTAGSFKDLDIEV